MKTDKKTLNVSAICEGTVIDHIPSDATLKVVEILKLYLTPEIVSIAYNLPSGSMGKKGIVKVGGKSLSKKEIAKISIVAPHSTINIIHNFKVKEKFNLDIPTEVIGVVRCINPNCITNNEKVLTSFTVESKEPLKLRCIFCEECMDKENILVK